MARNLPCIGGDLVSITDRRAKIPQAVGQLSPHTTTTESACFRAHMPLLESLCTAKKDLHDASKIQCSQINK